jgi:hypothetical protein
MLMGLPQSWGSCGYGHCRVRIVGWLESLSEARVENGAGKGRHAPGTDGAGLFLSQIFVASDKRLAT